MAIRLQPPASKTQTRSVAAGLCGLLLASCVPGPVIISPPVSGDVTDGRTGKLLAGALVTLNVEGRLALRSGPTGSPPHTLSDGHGHFVIARRLGLGLVGYIGDPPEYRATVSVTKAGYDEFTTTQPCNGRDGDPSAPVYVEAALKPQRHPQ